MSKIINLKPLIWIGLSLVPLAGGVAYSFQKEIKKQLIEFRNKSATEKYADFTPAENLCGA